MMPYLSCKKIENDVYNFPTWQYCKYKDILSITVGANETSKFWLGMLNDLKNRGVKDVLFFCVDGLPGFKEAIQAVYPQAEIQRCVIHMLRNSFKYVNYNDLKKFSSDFKEVYNAPNETAALTELENMKEKWGKKYPYAISNWENNWEDVSSFFQFSNDIRRIMYTTNIIEGLNRQYRKVTKKKSRNREALLSPHSCPLSIPQAFVLLPSVISFQTNIWLSDFLLFLNLKHIVWFQK